MADHSKAYRIILDKPENWHTWLSSIKSGINNEEIWDLVNPDLVVKPKTLSSPRQLTRPGFAQDGTINAGELEHYKALKIFFEEDMARFKEQNKALRAINILIFETTSAARMNDVAYSDSDPWSKLVALKQRLRPDNKSQMLLVEKRYHQLAKGPVNQSEEAWLDEWSDMYHEAKRLNLDEARGDRAIRDFFLAVEVFSPIYSIGRTEARSTIDDSHTQYPDTMQVKQKTMEEEIEKLRQRLRLQSTSEAAD